MRFDREQVARPFGFLDPPTIAVGLVRRPGEVAINPAKRALARLRGIEKARSNHGASCHIQTRRSPAADAYDVVHGGSNLEKKPPETPLDCGCKRSPIIQLG